MASKLIYTDKPVAAAITLKDDPDTIYYWDPQDEDSISEFLSDFDYPELNQAPAFMEAAAWCTLAPIGSTYESDEFEIEIIDTDGLDEDCGE